MGKSPPHLAFGLRLIELRQAAGIRRQADFAQRIKAKQQTVSRWEAGTSRPRDKQLPLIAEALLTEGAKVDDLLNDLRVVAGYSVKTAKTVVKSFDQPFPVDALLPESFERFCAHLLERLYPKADVHRMGGTGHTQDGTDITAKMEDSAVYSFQCKRAEEFGPQKVHEAVAKHTVKAAKKFLVLSRTASPQAREAISIHPGWDIWDKDDLSRKVRGLPVEEQVRLVDIFFAGRRFELLGVTEEGIWETPEEFFEVFENAAALFNHTWTLVGREDALLQLDGLLNDTAARLVFLTGAGGSGKSRVLKRAVEKFKADHKGTTIRLLSRTSSVTKKSLAELRAGPTLLVVDDAHDRTDLPLLFEFAAARTDVKLLLALRPYGLDNLKAQAGMFALVDTAKELALGALSKQQAEELAKQVLEKEGGPIKAAEDIAHWTYDCPLATVVGAQIVAREKKHFELAKNEASFRSALFSSFSKVIAGEIGQKSDTEPLKKLLKLLSLLQPFHIDDKDLPPIVEQQEGIPPHETNRLLKLLIDSGILFKRGARYRLSPDVLADYIIEDTCVGADNQSTGYAEAVFDKLPSRFVENLVVNLGKLDWQRSDGDTSKSRLLDGIWSKLQPSHDYSDPHIKAVAEIAYFQPGRALDFAERLMRQGKFLDQLPAIIRPAAHNMQHVERACGDLWELGKDDNRELNRHHGHAIRILGELCEVRPDKPREYNEKVVDFGLGLLHRPDSWTHRCTPIDVLKPILSTEGHTTTSTGRAISFSPYFINVEFVKELRQKVVAALVELLSNSDVRIAVLAAHAIGAAVRYPMGMFGAQVTSATRKAWTAVFVETLEAVEKAKNKSLDPLVLFTIAKEVSWLGQFGEPEVAEVAKRLRRGLPQKLEVRVLFALRDGHGTELRRMESVKDFGEWGKRVDKLTQEIVAAYPDGPQLLQLLTTQLVHLEKNDPEAGGSHYVLLAKLIYASSALARAIVDDAYSNPTSPMSRYAGFSIAQLWNADVAEGRAAIQRFIDSGRNVLLRSVGHALDSINIKAGKHGAVEISALDKVLIADDPDVVLSGILALRHFATEEPDLVVQLAPKANIGANQPLADELSSLFTWQQLVPYDRLSQDDVGALLDKLMAVPKIEGHWLELFLAHASRAFPQRTAQFFMDRVDRAARDADWSYQACSTMPHSEEVRLKFSETPDYGPLLARVVAWMREATYTEANRLRFNYASRELFDAMFGSFDGEVLAYLDRWSLTADEQEFKLIANILREAPSDFSFTNKEFVIQLLERAKQVSPDAMQRLSESLFSSAISGVRSGVAGEPFPRDIKLKNDAEATLAALSRISPAYTLYEWIKEHAASNIERAHRDREAYED
jgi:transcriptional regulator with XRE-family HTH domain